MQMMGTPNAPLLFSTVPSPTLGEAGLPDGVNMSTAAAMTPNALVSPNLYSGLYGPPWNTSDVLPAYQLPTVSGEWEQCAGYATYTLHGEDRYSPLTYSAVPPTAASPSLSQHDAIWSIHGGHAPVHYGGQVQDLTGSGLHPSPPSVTFRMSAGPQQGIAPYSFVGECPFVTASCHHWALGSY